MRKLKVFVASPADVDGERSVASAILKKLKKQYQTQVQIEATLWEEAWYEARSSIQQELPFPCESDLVIVILWSRMGRQPYSDPQTGRQYTSCTRFEIANAFHGNPARPPRVVICRCRRKLGLDPDMAEADLLRCKSEWAEVNEFFDVELKRDFGAESVNDYGSNDDFAEKFESIVSREVDRYLKGSAAGSEDAGGAEIPNPYKGLSVFGVDDQAMFFGRTRDVHRAVARLNEQNRFGRPFQLIVGRSGVGKSSFARAGVVPHLINSSADPEAWLVAIFEPSDSTDDLLGGLAAALTAEDVLPNFAPRRDEIARLLRDDPEKVVRELRGALDQSGAPRRIVLVVDPLEEIFTRQALKARENRKNDVPIFAHAMRVLCNSQLVWIIATVRSDFWSRCLELDDLRALDGDNGGGAFRLDPLSPTALAQAVAEPALRVNVQFEGSDDGRTLAEDIVDAASKLTDPLPLLSYAMQELFERSHAGTHRLLTRKAFADLGELDGILMRRADQARKDARTDLEDKDADRAWDTVFGLLVEIDREGLRARLYARQDDDRFKDKAAARLIDELNRARLLISDKNDRNEPVLSIAHETMMHKWPALDQWIRDRQELLLARRRLTDSANDWDRSGRTGELLTLQGARLATAEEFFKNPRGLAVQENVEAFIRAHTDRRDAEALAEFKKQRKLRAINRAFITTLALAFLISVGLATFAWSKKTEAAKALETADFFATHSSNLANYMLDDLKGKLNPSVERDSQLINDIATRLTAHYAETANRAGTVDDKLKQVQQISKHADVLSGLSAWNQAITLETLVVTILERIRGQDSPDLIRPLIQIGNWNDQASKYTAAYDAYSRAKSLSQGDSPEAKAQRFEIDYCLAKMYRREGRYALAGRMVTKVIDQASNGDDAAKAKLPEYYELLAECNRLLGKLDAARAAMEKAVSVAQALHDGAYLFYRSELGIILALISHDNTPNAKQWMLEARNVSLSSKGREERYAQYGYKLARIMIDEKQFAEAELILMESEKILRAKSSGTSKLAKCLEACAKLRLAQGRTADAETYAREVVNIRENLFSASMSQRDVIDAYALLAECLKTSNPADSAFYSSKAATLERERQKREELDASIAT